MCIDNKYFTLSLYIDNLYLSNENFIKNIGRGLYVLEQ
jgi:hypothetical protein